jgi:hypothetical protein
LAGTDDPNKDSRKVASGAAAMAGGGSGEDNDGEAGHASDGENGRDSMSASTCCAGSKMRRFLSQKSRSVSSEKRRPDGVAGTRTHNSRPAP